MRIRACSEVQISGCVCVSSLRGYRIQDCSRGRISDCVARSCLESGFYLAAGTYTGASGCTNFVISGCAVQDVLNNAYLVIGGSNNTISACLSTLRTAQLLRGIARTSNSSETASSEQRGSRGMA